MGFDEGFPLVQEQARGFNLEVPSPMSSEYCVTLTQVATSLSSNDFYMGKLEVRAAGLARSNPMQPVHPTLSESEQANGASCVLHT